MEQNSTESPEKNWPEIAEKLDLLQKDKNQGRGDSVTRDIINCLRRGDIKSAKHIASWDHDKIDKYPDIEEFLEKNIFEDDPDSPVKLRKRIEEKFGWKNK